jgi:Na+/proline symporter
MDQINILSQNLSLTLILSISLFFATIGIIYSKKYKGLENYLIANRDVGILPLTTSLIASALGSWILFGPASAATWGGIGSVIGYSLGAAFPMIALIFLGSRIRKIFPKGKTITEFVKYKFGKNLFILVLILTIFYIFIFLCAEITAVAILIQYISGTPLWITAMIVITSTLTYTLYGGLRASIFTDNIQFFIIAILFLISVNYILTFENTNFSFSLIKQKTPHLISMNYIPNFTAGLTFFIAVATTNLFHQGNWQRVFAAKNEKVLKQSLLISFFIIIPIVFFMGFSGLIAVSQNTKVNPDLAFFSILLNEQTKNLSLLIIVFAISLTISTVDTLINAISSLIIVDGKNIFKFKPGYNFLKLSKYFVIVISLISFFIASKGFSILYLFLLADLLCCSAVFTVFYGFYKKIRGDIAMISILVGLFLGLLLFPSFDFSKSILIGVLLSHDLFPLIVSNYLLFWSFFIATVGPAIVIMFHDSFKR